MPGLRTLRRVMVQQNGGTIVLVGSGTFEAKTVQVVARGGGDWCGDTCRELLQSIAALEVERLEAAQVPEPFGEWQVRQEQKIRVNLLGVI